MRIYLFLILSVLLCYAFIGFAYVFGEEKGMMGMVMVMEAIFIVPGCILNAIFLELSTKLGKRKHKLLLGNCAIFLLLIIMLYNPFILSNSSIILLLSFIITNTIWFLKKGTKS
jgi:hypothetical protein